MLDEIVLLTRETRLETGRVALAEKVRLAMAKVPRHEFVPADQKRHAYENRPLSIGHGQTISQPFIVALMTDIMDIKPTDRVLEIGTGSGYQAAVLAELAATVYTIEIVEPLGRQAAATFSRLGYRNVHTRVGDGYRGWPEHAPYDSIMVTAAPADVPEAAHRAVEAGRQARRSRGRSDGRAVAAGAGETARRNGRPPHRARRALRAARRPGGKAAMSDMNVLVTGGAGFIGSHSTEALLEHGARVRVLDNFSTGKRDNLPAHERLSVIEGDIRDRAALAARDGGHHARAASGRADLRARRRWRIRPIPALTTSWDSSTSSTRRGRAV